MSKDSRRTVSGRRYGSGKPFRVWSARSPAASLARLSRWSWPIASRSSPAASASAPWWRNTWRGEAPTSRWSIARRRADAEETAEVVRGHGRRAQVIQADLSQRGRLRAGRRGRRWRRSGASTCWSTWRRSTSRCARRPDARGLERPARRRPARVVAVRAGRGAAHAPPARRTHHQLLRLGGGQRPAALHRLPRLLRREGGGDRADRSAGARAGRRSDPGERHGARADRGARRAPRTGSSAPWSAPRRSGAGAARSRSPRPSLSLVESDFITGETIRVDGGRHLR